MKILGYSERGAMNALFYGMNFNAKGEEQMRKFLELAKIDAPDSFSHFEIYNEFSLSEFGNPDLVIIAQNKEKKKYVFFVESKVSNGTSYNIDDQKEKHEKDLKDYKDNNNCHNKGDASNLFFQLRLKHFFFEQRETIIEPVGGPNEKTEIDHACIENTKGRNGEIRLRKLGSNPIVIKFAEKIKECIDAYYIAIVPKQERENPVDYSLDSSETKTMRIYFVSWEDIFKEDLGQLKDTFEFNKNGNVSLILNNPKTK